MSMQVAKLKIRFSSDLAKSAYGEGELLGYQTSGSSGIDLRAVSIRERNSSVIKVLIQQDSEPQQASFDLDNSTEFIDEYILEPGKRVLVGCGIQASIDKGLEMQIRSRSGMSWNHGIVVMNSPGTIDSDYRGDICAMINNSSDESFIITQGIRIAQMVIAPVTIANIVFTNELDETDRGTGGFGSTGSK